MRMRRKPTTVARKKVAVHERIPCIQHTFAWAHLTSFEFFKKENDLI
jgi:hypothetical protein